MLVSRFGAHLTLVELAAGALPVGAICSAWAVYLVACLTSAVGPHTLFGSSALLAFAVGFGTFISIAEFNVSLGPQVPIINAVALVVAGTMWWRGWVTI